MAVVQRNVGAASLFQALIWVYSVCVHLCLDQCALTHIAGGIVGIRFSFFSVALIFSLCF